MRRSVTLTAVVALAFSLIPAVAVAAGSCGDPYTAIYDIQGDGDESPLHHSFPDPQAVVTTEGVVTVDVQLDEEWDGFFLQDLKGDKNPATSDGIFVFHRADWDYDVSVGEHLRVEAEVDEFFTETQLENVTSIERCGMAKVKRTRVKTRDFNANPEQYEGMYVQFKGRLHVTDTFFTYRFGEVWLGDDSVIEQPTDVFPGGSVDEAPRMHALAEDNMDQSVLLGSRLNDRTEPPFTRRGDTLRVGDTIFNPTGAIKYSFNYKMINNPDPVFRPTNRRRPAPRVRGDLVVASFNVLNYWTTLGGRGAQNADQLAIQTEKLVAAITGMGADIVGLQEMENDPISPQLPVQTLVAALNTAEGSDVWSYIEGFDQNIYPIVNEIIYRNDRVSPVGDPMSLADPAFDDFRGDTGLPDDQLGRRPIAQAFEQDGKTFSIVVNHFKSKSNTGAMGDDADQGDGQSSYNARRVMQAEAVLDWIDDVVDESGDKDVLVVGDLNAYLREDPVLTLENELFNLVKRYERNPYSFQFFASFAAPFIGRGTLDHALATPTMRRQVRDVDIWHINADEPCWVHYYDDTSSCFDRGGLPDPGTLAPGPFGSSDHDPVLIGIKLKRDNHPRLR